MFRSQLELSESRPPFVIIRMSDFKLACTYICTSAHYTLYYNDYKIFIVTQYFICSLQVTLGDIMQLKKTEK